MEILPLDPDLRPSPSPYPGREVGQEVYLKSQRAYLVSFMRRFQDAAVAAADINQKITGIHGYGSQKSLYSLV